MRRWVGWIVFLCLLAGGATVCAIRWEAWFGNPPAPEWNEPIIEHQFKTFDNDSVLHSLQCDTLSFLLLGDIHNSLSQEQMAMLTERHSDVQWWAQLGDWMERPYVYYEQMMYRSIIGTGLAELPIAAVPGNHEHLKGVEKTLPERWKSIFPNPENGPDRFLGTSYYVDFPHMRLIAIDTDGLQRLSDYTRVVFWLKQTVRGANGRFAVVMMHHPVYSTAEGRCNPVMWLAFRDAMREADVVFSGHDHNYARHTEHYEARFWKIEKPTVFIATNASTKVYPAKENRKYECAFSGEPVYEYIVVTPQRMHIYTLNLTSGEKIDEVTIDR